MTRHGVSGVECPECGSVRTRTLATGRTDDGIRLRRRRCIDCYAVSFLTVEVPIEATWGELDTDYKLRQRDYSRRKQGYQGRYSMARTRPMARLEVKVKVVRAKKKEAA